MRERERRGVGKTVTLHILLKCNERERERGGENSY
jgi:hypothetical protein